MTALEQEFQKVATLAGQLERSVADAKAGYGDVLRQVMLVGPQLSDIRTRIDDNERAALKRHDELLAAIAKLGGDRG